MLKTHICLELRLCSYLPFHENFCLQCFVWFSSAHVLRESILHPRPATHILEPWAGPLPPPPQCSNSWCISPHTVFWGAWDGTRVLGTVGRHFPTKLLSPCLVFDLKKNCPLLLKTKGYYSGLLKISAMVLRLSWNRFWGLFPNVSFQHMVEKQDSAYVLIDCTCVYNGVGKVKNLNCPL